MPSIATDVRYDASNGTLGTPLTGEGTLGLKGQLKQGAIDLQFRMVDRHRIRAQFYKQTRSGDVVLNQQVRFGDDVYIVNDRVVSNSPSGAQSTWRTFAVTLSPQSFMKYSSASTEYPSRRGSSADSPGVAGRQPASATDMTTTASARTVLASGKTTMEDSMSELGTLKVGMRSISFYYFTGVVENRSDSSHTQTTYEQGPTAWSVRTLSIGATSSCAERMATSSR